MLTHHIETDKSLYDLVLKRAHLFIVALVAGQADDGSRRRESVAVGWMWWTLPRTYVRGYRHPPRCPDTPVETSDANMGRYIDAPDDRSKGSFF